MTEADRFRRMELAADLRRRTAAAAQPREPTPAERPAERPRAIQAEAKAITAAHQAAVATAPKVVLAPPEPVRGASVPPAPFERPPPPAPDISPDDGRPSPAVARIRSQVNLGGAGSPKGRTIAPKRLSREERSLAETLDYPTDIVRPQTRGDCQGGSRPCPFVSCSHNLFLDVNEDSGALKLNFPHLDPDQMTESCSLDVADRGGITLEEVGAIMNLTRERIRQVEARGLINIRIANPALADSASTPDPGHSDGGFHRTPLARAS